MDKISMMNRSIARFHTLQIRRKSLEKFYNNLQGSPQIDEEEFKKAAREIWEINGESMALIRCMRSDLMDHPDLRIALVNNPKDIAEELFDVLFHTEDLRVEKRLGQNQRNFRRAS